MNIKLKRSLICGAIGAISPLVVAAPGTIANQPLSTGKEPPSNIMFLVDDSGSMSWDFLKADEAAYNSSAALRRCAAVDALHYDPNQFINHNAKLDGKITDAAAEGQTLVYTPEDRLYYTPWRGLDHNDVPYEHKSLTSALRKPNASPSALINNKVNLTDLTNSVNKHDYFYKWTDATSGPNHNDKYDSGECNLNHKIYVHTLSANQQVDYANWYTYYRIRDYVAKKALSEVIVQSSARIGLATLHNNDSVGIPVKDIDDITTPVDDDYKANKKALLKSLFRIRPSGGTPLRQSLERVGKYYSKATDSSTNLFGAVTESPILPISENGECQQNFAVVMSDGFWNGGDPSVSNADGDNNTKFDKNYNNFKYKDSYSNTLADVAMHYYEGDLAPGYADLVGPELDTSPGATPPAQHLNRAQHMETYSVAFGVSGSLTEAPTDGVWPQPVKNTGSTVDDMLHAAHNSRGKYFNAKNPGELVEALLKALTDIGKKSGSASALALNNVNLTANSAFYRAGFNPNGWTGNLEKVPLIDDTSGASRKLKAGTPVWNAASLLRGKDSSERQVATYNGAKGVAFAFPVDFENPLASELSANQVADLLQNKPRSSSASTQNKADNTTYGERMVAYLRGDDTYEQRAGISAATVTSNFNKTFRGRGGSKLGDIIHSSPVYVGKSQFTYPDTLEAVKYSTYVAQTASRRPMVYVGANDGMLHAFDDETGEEAFAYMPGLLFDDNADNGVQYLASKTYAHLPYVDGSPKVQDVFVDGVWKTYLIGTLRGGGRGMYILDITNPTQNTQARADKWVLGEFTHKDLGYGFSDPQIVKLNDGRWAAVMGNGYNSSPDGDGHAKLFIYYLSGAAGKAKFRVLETKFKVFSDGELEQASDLNVNRSCKRAKSDCNGMSTPLTLDTDGDYVVDRAYAGDLHGNMWAFDLSSETPTDWAVAYSKNDIPKPLFRACSEKPCRKWFGAPINKSKVQNRQPITAKPRAVPHRQRKNSDDAPSLMIYFGTGQFLADGDQANTDLQSVYGVWDAGKEGNLRREHLQAQTLSVISSGHRTVSDNSVDYDTQSGWRIDLPKTRERIVTSVIKFDDAALFTTIVPDVATCTTSPTGFLMGVDLLTGGKLKSNLLSRAVGTTGENIAGYSLGASPGQVSAVGPALAVPTSDGKVKLFTIESAGESGKLTTWAPLR